MRICPVARGRFDARHFDLELAHRFFLPATAGQGP
jgi:hypothetical protein